MINNNVDICFLQETFLQKHDRTVIKEVEEFGMKLYSVPRIDGREHGGLAVLTKSCINLKTEKSASLNTNKFLSFEFFESVFKTNSGLIRFCNIYRPTYSQNHRFTLKHFIKEFKEYLEKLALKPGYTILLGDFNIHVEKYNDYYVKAFNELLIQFGLQQKVPISMKTQVSGGTLDLIIISEDLPHAISEVDILPHGTESDHFLVCSSINCSKEYCQNDIDISYRNFKSLDINVFKEELQNSHLCNANLSTISLEELTKLYQDVLTELFNKYCPVLIKKKNCYKNKKDAWFDSELKELLNKCRIAERRWRKTGLNTNKCKYNEVQKLYNLTVKLKRKAHHSKSITLSKDNKRVLFSKLNALLGNEKVFLPNNEDHSKIANDFAQYFQNKINTIRSNIDEEKNSFDDEITDCELCDFERDTFAFFDELTLEDLKKLLGSMNNKFCCLDPVPSWVLTECFDELGPILIQIINKSLTTGVFPTQIKTSVVKPTVKDQKRDLDELSNYRPVSNIPFLSKIIEKVVLFQLDEYLSKNNLYCTQQSGYRKYHSCETLNIKMFDEILKDVDSGNIVALVLLDMSAAFDTVDHTLLLDLLKKCYGITGKVLHWFSTYLKDRRFSVNVYNTFSEYVNAIFGVPQGSILGPILFILYTKHLQHIAFKHGLNIQLYADDTQLYIGFKHINQNLYSTKISDCLYDIKKWVCNQFLKLNEQKTKLVLVSKPSVHNLLSYNDSMVISMLNTGSNIGEVDWDSESEIISLGIRLDPNLDMNKHVSYVRKYCIGTLKSWKRITTFLSEDVRLLLVKQILLPKIDYNNALLAGLPNYVIQDLQYLINCALRFIYNVGYREHITPYIIKSHILPVRYRIEYKICLIVFNCLHNVAPSYLQDLLTWNQPTRTNIHYSDIPRKTQDPYLLVIPVDFGNKTRYRWRTFSHYAPKCWNKLSYDIRSCNNKSSFKTKLKTHFFNLFLLSKVSD